jgi:predicted Zn-dependent protease
MQQTFYQLADSLVAERAGDEVLLLDFAGERSDFVRFNNSLVRQAGNVLQQYLDLELVSGDRHASETITLSGDGRENLHRALTSLEGLRARLPQVPADPYLLYSEEVRSSEKTGECKLPPVKDAVGAILTAGVGKDLVGIHAQGESCRGFANSLGQRNWFSTHSFHLEWCLYAHGDKAVKSAYAGFEWSNAELALKMATAADQLSVLGRPAKTIPPGEYRLYLAPAAFAEFADMLGWGGYGLKSHRTKTTCLLKMLEEGAAFSPLFSARENTVEGLSPNFTDAGYVKPDSVSLITEGRFDTCLVSPRSAKEYGVEVNSDGESPSSLDLTAGDLPREEVLQRLGDGVYCNQLWYLNWSDMPACRITGMTRFATFWVEGGEIVAPLNVMRFDETGYRALGSNLLGLTRERDFLPDSGTYDARSTDSARVPGALIEGFRFTL